MTGQTGGGNLAISWHAPPDLLAGYAAGTVDGAVAWSLEVHLPGCPACRAALSQVVEPEHLARNRRAVLAGAALPTPGLVERGLGVLGVPGHLSRLLVLTPALRRSWFAAIALVLGVALGAAWLAPVAGATPTGTWGPGGLGAGEGWRLVGFFTLVPLLPLAGVGVAFSPVFDRTHALVAAAPFSGLRLFFVRTAAVFLASLVPALAASFALPGPGWLTALLLLPSLAVSALALLLATAVEPMAAAGAAGAVWVLSCACLGEALRSPMAIFGHAGQLGAAVVLAGSFGLLAVCRRRVERVWAR